MLNKCFNKYQKLYINRKKIKLQLINSLKEKIWKYSKKKNVVE